MKNKIYYLMLLLCLTLLPLRVYAIDNLNDDNNDQVIVGNELGNENVPGEKELGNGNLSDEKNEVENKKVVGADNEEDAPMATVTYPEVFVINTATLELTANEIPSFTATIPEDARYALDLEYWGNAWDTLFYYNNSDYNTFLREMDELIDPFTFGELYYYYVTLSFYGEEPINDEDFFNYPFVLNGEEIVGTLIESDYDEEEHLIYVTYLLYETTPLEGEIQDIESLEINNVNLNATDGKAPLYGATVEDENVDLLTEWWYTYDDDDEETWLANYSDPSYLDEDETLFDTFQQKYRYTLALFLLPKTGYALKIKNDSNSNTLFSAKINGEAEKDYDIYKYYKEGNLVSYILYVAKNIVPVTDTYNVVEHGDTTIDKSEGTGLALRTDGSHEKYIGVYVDGKLVEAETAIDANGNSIVRFTDEYLQTLDVGEHEIAVSYNDGKNAYTSLTITDVNAQEEQNNNNAVNTVENNVTSNYVATTLTTNVSNVLQEKVEEPKKEESTEGKKDDTNEESKAGLWIGLVILGLIAVVIPIAIYKQDE